MPYADKERQRQAVNDWYTRNRDKHKAAVRAHRLLDGGSSNRAKVKAYKKQYPEKVSAWRIKEREERGGIGRLHNAHVRVWEAHRKKLDAVARRAVHRKPWNDPGLTSAEKYRIRYHSDPNFRLKERLRNQFRAKSEAVPELAKLIRQAMKAGARSRRVERLLRYSISQFRVHLERQFVREMSWDSFGRHGWHIDHILPRKCFDLTTIEGVRAYWALSNLRPLSARENIRKGARVETLL